MGVIQLPGFINEIQPALQQIGGGIQNLVNPDWQRQQMLREMMLRNPELAQQLTDMGSQRVEEVYGKGTGGFAGSGPVSGKKLAENELSKALPEIFKDPKKREEWLAGQTGTLTDAKRKIQDQTIQGNEVSIATGQLNLEDKRDEITHERDNRVLAGQAIGKVGGSGNLYQAKQSGKLTLQELAAIQAIPEYKSIYEGQQNDYWKQQQLAFQREQETRLANNQKSTLTDVFERQDALLARQYADQANRSNAADVFLVLRDRKLFDKYIALDKPPTDAKDLALYEAAHAVKDARGRQTREDESKAWQQFRLATAGIHSKLVSASGTKNTGLDEQTAQQLVEQYNMYSASILRPILGEKAPIIAFDKEGVNSKRGWMQSERPTIRTVQGQDSAITNRAPVNPAIEAAAQDVIAGRASLGELVSKGTPEQRAQLTQRVAELQGDTTTTTPTPVSPSITTGGESKVKEALTIGTDTLNLNRGESVKVKPEAAPTKKDDSIFRSLTSKQQFTYLTGTDSTKDIQKVSKQPLVQAVLVDALSEGQLNQLVGYFREKGYIANNGPSVTAQPGGEPTRADPAGGYAPAVRVTASRSETVKDAESAKRVTSKKFKAIPMSALESLELPDISIIIAQLKKLNKFDPSELIETYYGNPAVNVMQ